MDPQKFINNSLRHITKYNGRFIVRLRNSIQEMLGRLDRIYKLSLLGRKTLHGELKRYDIITRKIRSSGTSRLQKVGEISCRSQYTMVKLDRTKLYQLLATTNLCITASVWKVMGMFGESKFQHVEQIKIKKSSPWALTNTNIKTNKRIIKNK